MGLMFAAPSPSLTKNPGRIQAGLGVAGNGVVQAIGMIIFKHLACPLLEVGGRHDPR